MDFNAKHYHIISIKAEDGGASSHRREGRYTIENFWLLISQSNASLDESKYVVMWNDYIYSTVHVKMSDYKSWMFTLLENELSMQFI